MTDRMDIDALLISALYGELTPAEEAQLTAHLESHPADRTALADLTHTRATVRESRIFSVQFDPPQSVSAMLLQEAARRAPKPASEAAGWFHRFTRSFMMHPAMAAAAMLVLVVGVAGTLYLRRGDQMFAESAAPRPATAPVSTNETLSTTTPATPPAAGATRAAPEPAPSGDNTVAPATGASGSAAGSDAYRVGLDEAAGRRKAEATAAKPAKPAPKGSLGGIEVRSPEMMPKELDDDRGGRYGKNDRNDKVDKVARAEQADTKDAAKRGFASADADSARASATTAANAQQAPGAGAAGGGAATVAPGMIPPQNHAAAAGPAGDPGAAPAAEAPRSPVNDARNNARNDARNDAKAKAPAKTVSRSNSAQAQAQAPSPQPSSSPPPPAAAVELSKFRADNRQQADKPLANQANAKPADVKLADEAGEDKALIGWAQKQHDQVLALVKSNNCRAAANAAVEIYNRAPDYYAANIATDRSIKPCIAYVNNERERVDRSRAAAKRANAADTPAQAAPPPPPPARK